MQSMHQVGAEPLNDDELMELAQLLEDHVDEDSPDAICDLSELDGFLTAVISSPQLCLPHYWMAHIWGGNEFEPDWESEEAYAAFAGLLFRHYNSTQRTLNLAPDSFHALFSMGETEEGEEIYMADDWCVGYLKGMQLWQVNEIPAELTQAIKNISLHALPENFPLIDEMTMPEYQTSLDRLHDAVLDVYAYFFERRKKSEPMRLESTVGRNDPCPCGSGKKYKKCCLH